MKYSLGPNTERGVLSVARFFHVFPCELRGLAWAIGSYSISQSAGGASQNIIYQNLATDRTPHSVALTLRTTDSFLQTSL